MPWDEIRAEISTACHEQFGIPALYYRYSSLPGPVIPASVDVRLHSRHIRTGDLERDGYAEVTEEVERIVFLREQLDAPIARSTVDVNGRYFRLDVQDSRSDETISVWDVTEVSSL